MFFHIQKIYYHNRSMKICYKRLHLQSRTAKEVVCHEWIFYQDILPRKKKLLMYYN